MVAPKGERLAGLAWIPVCATVLFYLLPSSAQHSPAVVVLPQASAYLCLIAWTLANDCALGRLGLDPARIVLGIRPGILVGLLLGTVNVIVILHVIPRLGGDILFLRETPHARVPPAIMLPWFILLIAIFVEVNFRGFLLGRLLVLVQRWTSPRAERAGVAAAVLVSAFVFSFDPFMVSTFRHLHWIAVWDGFVWGMMWIRLKTLAATIIAHTVEVIVMYGVLKLVLR